MVVVHITSSGNPSQMALVVSVHTAQVLNRLSKSIGKKNGKVLWFW